MNPAEPPKRLWPRPQHEVVGVAEDDLRAHAQEIRRGAVGHRRTGADVHEHGRLDATVRGQQRPPPRTRAWIGRADAERSRHRCLEWTQAARSIILSLLSETAGHRGSLTSGGIEALAGGDRDSF